jgi:hypothetical protein
MEAQARDRDAALEAFHSSIEARAARAGATAVAEGSARAAREERLARQSEERAAREAEAKVGALRGRGAGMTQ